MGMRFAPTWQWCHKYTVCKYKYKYKYLGGKYKYKYKY